VALHIVISEVDLGSVRLSLIVFVENATFFALIVTFGRLAAASFA